MNNIDTTHFGFKEKELVGLMSTDRGGAATQATFVTSIRQSTRESSAELLDIIVNRVVTERFDKSVFEAGEESKEQQLAGSAESRI